MSNDPREELSEISNRLATLERNFEDHQSAISWQLECTRRLHQRSDGVSELRTSAATAKFLSEDESVKEGTVRSVTMYLLGCVQQEVESFILPLFEAKHFPVLSMKLEKIQRIVREATLASPALSMDRIEREARSILQELDGVSQWAKTTEDEEMSKRVAEIKRDCNEA